MSCDRFLWRRPTDTRPMHPCPKWGSDFVFFIPFQGSQKLPLPTVFHVVMAGYWEKFSTSNSRASVEPHWLRHCLCAKLILWRNLKHVVRNSCKILLVFSEQNNFYFIVPDFVPTRTCLKMFKNEEYTLKGSRIL